MNQSLNRIKLSPKKIEFLTTRNQPESLTSKIIEHLAHHPRSSTAQIKEATGTRGYAQLLHGNVNPTLVKHGYLISYEVLPGDPTSLWSIFKIKDGGE